MGQFSKLKLIKQLKRTVPFHESVYEPSSLHRPWSADLCRRAASDAESECQAAVQPSYTRVHREKTHTDASAGDNVPRSLDQVEAKTHVDNTVGS